MQINKKNVRRTFNRSTLFNFKGTDYLFVSFNELGSDQVLRCYISDDITSELKEHPTSPIIVDHALGRSAGRIFKIDNKIIRPSQQNISSYGSSTFLRVNFKQRIY